ncbi:MAG: isoleucine--tRNA ligase [Proteobacteria bacterium]|nr:isoleucine--tRNA ligase [Pseudomonadota bacterium]
MFERLPDQVKLEGLILEFWEKEHIFEQSIEQSRQRPPFVFYEGPPTANGTPHNGHVLTRVIKDVFPRYRTMRGYFVDRKAGWDTHGLPVEVEVEKTLNMHGKESIEAYGLENFSRRCVESVFSYVKEWESLTRNIGFWVDLDKAYVTYHRSYVESVWWALSELFNRGVLYKGQKVVWWWPQGGTTLSAGEVGMGYKEVNDPAITLRFRDADDPDLSYLAWTTTPWTLISNVALAVAEKVDYAFCDDPDGGTVVVAKDLAGSFGLVPKFTKKGSELVGRSYVPLYDFGPVEGGKSFVIVEGHHVTTSAGTGIVHTAPAFGEDDMMVAKKQGLGVLQWVLPNGCFAKNTGFVAGLFCKDADRLIIKNLEERKIIFKRETIRHEYPFCWRADDDPLIQYARPAWFIRTTDYVEDVLANNAAVGWSPEHIREGRFGDFLRNNVDWALSRERFWGTPLPIWECGKCSHKLAVGSVAQLHELGAEGFDGELDEHLQVHRPWIDEITLPCTKCGAKMHRVTEVIDCWFDSGCMPFAQWGFPHQNRETFARSYPADFISEAVDQTRGWFYSLMMISTMLFDDETCTKYGLDPVGFPRPYKNCVVLGHVCDVDGKKESKSKGNYTSPNLIFHGRTPLHVLPDPAVKPGTVGLLKDQVKSLDLSKNELVSIYATDDGPRIKARVVPAKVTAKDTCHLNPDELASLGDNLKDIWFHIPIDPPGADAFRWLFCYASPSWSNTRLSLRAIRDGQREFLLRMRNVVQFFSIYANIAIEQGNFALSQPAPPVAERHALDRWIIHRLHQLNIRVANYMDDYHLYEASRELMSFVDALSNWYVRRSRSRFWGEGKDLRDSLWTLYEVLVDLSKMVAPFVPFTAEAIYGVLVVGPMGEKVPQSVHLESWPEPDKKVLDEKLAASMELVRELASLGLSARAATKVKVRQPLAAATIVLADPGRQSDVESLDQLLKDELNVREIEFSAEAHQYVQYVVKPNFKKLGPKLGKDVKRVAAQLSKMDGSLVKASLDDSGLTLDLDDRQVILSADEVIVSVLAQGGYQTASSPSAVVALSASLDEDLLAEGLVRELVNRIQNMRKEMDLGYTDRIALRINGGPEVTDALDRFGDTLRHEVLAQEFGLGFDGVDDSWFAAEWEVEEHAVQARIRPL